MFFRGVEEKHRVVGLSAVGKPQLGDKVVEWWVGRVVLYQFLNS